MLLHTLMQAGTNEVEPNPIVGFLPFIVLILILYFLMIRPQQKRQKEHQKLLENLKIGDQVITSGGIIGKIANFKKEKGTVVIKVDDNCKLEVRRISISGLAEDKQQEISSEPMK